MTTTKKHKITTPGYYFTYSYRQHPLFRDQTEKIASLYRKSDDHLINELNTEKDKVNWIDKFTHKQTIIWFDSILNPVEDNSIAINFSKWVKIESEANMPKPNQEVLIVLDYTEYGRDRRIEKAHVHFTEELRPYGGPNSLTGSGMLNGTYFSIPAILDPKIVTHWMPLPELPK